MSDNVKVKEPGRIRKWFRAMKSELKKVSWPSAKQVTKNTFVVLACLILVGLFVFVIDFGFIKLLQMVLPDISLQW